MQSGDALMWDKRKAAYAALFVLGLLVYARAAEIPGIVLTPVVPATVESASENTFSCLAVIYPYSTWQPNTNSSSQQPSSSPVPPYVEGSIDFSITNTGGSTVEAPWTLGIYNPVYTEVLQVHCLPSSQSHSARRNLKNAFASFSAARTWFRL